MAQAIKRYQVPVEQLILKNNGIKHQEFEIMLDCMQRHFEKVQVLTISHNRIGFKGANKLAMAFKEMKMLTHLDLSFDEIGDQGIETIAEQLAASPFSLEELDLSGNCLGKSPTSFQKVVPQVISMMANHSRLTSFKLSHNNMRGGHGGVDVLLKSFIEASNLKHLDLSHNLLGKVYGPQNNKRPPPICVLSEVLIKANVLEYLNIARNEMDQQAALCIAQGLSHTCTLKHIDVHGNPIGKFGMR